MRDASLLTSDIYDQGDGRVGKTRASAQSDARLARFGEECPMPQALASFMMLLPLFLACACRHPISSPCKKDKEKMLFA